MSDILIPAGPIVVRDRYCGNCVHWRGPGTDEIKKRIDEVFGAFYLDCRERGMGEVRSKNAVRNGLVQLDRKRAGVCTCPGEPETASIIARLAEGERATFTAELAICDRWTGRTQVHGPLDKLPDELRDILGLPQPTAPAPVMINAEPSPAELEALADEHSGRGDGGAS